MFEEDNQAYPIGFPAAPGQSIWYRQLQPYLGRKEDVSGKGVFICPSSYQKAQVSENLGMGTREGGVWGWLAYAQNTAINNGVINISSSDMADPENTILYADTDGWDACLYPDGTPGNVCYRHSGGNERSAEMERNVAGVKGKKRRANAIFIDGHVQLVSAAPRRLFTLVRD
jgi:prepilin-type processing-associated H-X9-DG protein